METIKHLLLDLDGTLLPMNQEKFVTYYMPLLAKAYLRAGVKIDPVSFVRSVWKGYYAMVNNDGSRTNEEVFWADMEGTLPVSVQTGKAIAENFYGGEFNQAIAVVHPTKIADQIVKTAKAKGMEVYLATNPVFPRCATMNRIRWAGLDAKDFRLITTYESCCYCKPSVGYFQSILDTFKLEPEECMMVGNDVEEDLAARPLGVKTYLVTDCLENPRKLPVETDYQGTLQEFLTMLEGAG